MLKKKKKEKEGTNQGGFIGVSDVSEQVSVGRGVLLEELTEEKLAIVNGGGARRRRVSHGFGPQRPRLGRDRRRSSRDGDGNSDSEETIDPKHFGIRDETRRDD